MECMEFVNALDKCKTNGQCVNVLIEYIEDKNELTEKLKLARDEYNKAKGNLDNVGMMSSVSPTERAGKKMAELSLAKKGVEIPFLT